MRRVLSVASECAPLVKTGGLADIVGALPGALAPEGVEMRVLLPGYPAVLAGLDAAEAVTELPALMGGPARILSATAAGLSVFVLEAAHLYDRPGNIYLGPDGRDWPDNAERFAALAGAAARIGAGRAGAWRPELLHLHDWQAGLAPVFLEELGMRLPVVMTIHNIAFPGLVPGAKMGALGLDPAGFTPEGFEFWGQVSMLKAGINWADRITTVSPSYARELTRPEFGMGFEGVLAARADRLTGILNGLDTGVWNPAEDAHLARPYRQPRGKAASRRALIAETGLDAGAAGPLAVVVSRLTAQKGIDLLIEALPALLSRGGQLAVLGAGDPGLEAALQRLAEAEPRVAVRIGYDEALAHRMVAGGDAMIVPSRFEPCGLTQLAALRYATVPVVALTGGLADTVITASPAALSAGVATGLQFHPVTADSLAWALADLCDLFAAPATFAAMQRNAMRAEVGWRRSAAAYAALYAEIAGEAE